MNRYATRFATLLVAVLLVASSSMTAGSPQAGEIGYDVSNGTYEQVSGGTLHATGSDIDGFYGVVSLPFSVNWNGTSYSTIEVQGDGSVAFTSNQSTRTNGKSDVTQGGSGPSGGEVINAWYNDLSGLPTGEIRTTTEGTAPDRVFVTQWRNVTRAPAGSTNDVFNFQIRINENDGSVDVVYGAMTLSGAMGARIGVTSNNGPSLDLVTRYHMTTWDNPRAYNNGEESIGLQGWAPSSGLTYSFSGASGDDASVSMLDNPDSPFAANTNQTIRVVVKNWGSTALDSVKINWSINGVVQTPVNFYPQPALQPGEEAALQLGTRSFAALSFNAFRAWTSAPNGAADVNPGNDMFMSYIAPEVSGRLNIAQGGSNNVFPSFRDCLRHLQVSGTSGDVNVWVFGGAYSQQVIVPMIAGDNMVTFLEAPDQEVIMTWQPANHPDGMYGDYESNHAQAFIADDANVTFRGLEFRVPNGLNWGGNIWSTGANNVVVENCLFTGPNNYLTVATPDWAINLEGEDLTVRNSTITKNKLGTMLRSNAFGSASFYGNSQTDVASQGLVVYSNDMMVDGNSMGASSGITEFTGMSLIGAGTCSNNSVAADLSAQQNSSVVGISAESMYWRGNTLTLFNNMISIAASLDAVGLDAQAGYENDEIVDGSKASGDVQGFNPIVTNIYHNSVNLTGAAGANGFSAAAVFSGSDEFAVINNIFHNAGSGTDGGYAVVIGNQIASPIGTSDFNNLMTTGEFVANYLGGDVARNTTGNPLADFHTAAGTDYNSSSVAVAFVGGSDLHILEIDNKLFGSSSIINAVSSDIDGDNRIVPYMGADEINPTINIIEQPQSRYACLGETFQLLCIADVTVGADVVYQWFKDGVELTGQTGAILTFSSIGYGAAGVYTCEVQATDGFSVIKVMSDAATIIIVRNTQITVQPKSQPVAPGSTIILEIAAEAIGAPTEFEASYQWQKRYWDANSTSYQYANIMDDGRITGAQSTRLTIREATDSDTSDTYVCLVTGYCGTARSKTANLFFPTVAASNNTPNACEGGTLQMEVSVIPSAIPGATLGYQWHFMGQPLSNGPNVSGANTKVLTIDNVTMADAGEYHCVATYSGVDGINSNTVTATVGTNPVITAQPAGDTLCEGETTMLIVGATGENVSVHWLIGTTEIPGASNDTLLIENATAANSGMYSVRVMNACGELVSEQVEILVNVAATITQDPTDVAVVDGETIEMTVVAAGSEPITYQWLRDGDTVVGATDAMYSVLAGINGNEAGLYSCIVSNACGTDTSNTANADVTVGVDGEEVLPGGYVLGLPSPNPTTDAVSFEYTVPSSQNVRIALTNIVGTTVATLVDGAVFAGTHRVEMSSQALNLAPGVYTYTFLANGTIAARQFVVVK